MNQYRFLATRRAFLAGLAGSVALPYSISGYAQDSSGAAQGVLNILPGWEPPMLVSLTSTSSLPLSAKITEGLLAFDHDLSPMPQLATEWSVSEDGLVYKFKLREGVRWHDGKPFTSADVAHSIEILKTAHPRGRTTFGSVKSIETPDDHNVVLTLDVATPYLLTALSAAESPIVPAHIYKGTDPATNPANSAPIGTGPFKFKEWVRGSHVEYVRNDDYWDEGKPYLEGLVARFTVDLASRAVGLETGELDVAYRTPVPTNDVPRLRENPKLNFEAKGYEYSPPNIMCIEFNLDNKYFSDIRVRQALAHAIDREAITKLVYFGLATPCASSVVPGLKAFHNPMPTPYAFDYERANAILDEAGYSKDATGKRFSFIIDHRTGDDYRRLADYLRATFSRIGVTVEARSQDLGTLGKRVYTDRDFDCQIASLSNLFDPQVGVQRVLWSKNFLKGVPFSNAMNYANPEVDKLLEASAIESNPEERIRMWKEIQQIVMEEVPCINMVFLDWYTIHNVRAVDHSDTAAGFEGNFANARII